MGNNLYIRCKRIVQKIAKETIFYLILLQVGNSLLLWIDIKILNL